MSYEYELFLAIKPGKPPFFAICFPNDVTTGSIQNVDILDEHSKMDVYVYYVGSKIDVRIEMVGTNFVRHYSNVNYNKHHFQSWMQHAMNAERINFGHVRRENSTYHLEYSQRDHKKFVKKMRNLYIMNFPGDKVLKLAMR